MPESRDQEDQREILDTSQAYLGAKSVVTGLSKPMLRRRIENLSMDDVNFIYLGRFRNDLRANA